MSYSLKTLRQRNYLLHTMNPGCFGMYSKDEILRLSVLEVITPLTFDENGEPMKGGLYDPVLGPFESVGQHCSSCVDHFDYCPGHLGHINLPVPVFNPLFIKTLHQLLLASCLHCHSLLASVPSSLLLKAQLSALDCGLVNIVNEMGDAVSQIMCEGDCNLEDKVKDKLQSMMNTRRSSCSVHARDVTTFRQELIRKFTAQELLCNVKTCPHCNTPKETIFNVGNTWFVYTTPKADELGKKVPDCNCNRHSSSEGIGDCKCMPIPNPVAKCTSERCIKDGTSLLGPNMSILTHENARKHLAELWKKEKPLLQHLYRILALPNVPAPTDLFFLEVVAVAPPKYRPFNVNSQCYEHPLSLALRKVVHSTIMVRQIVSALKGIEEPVNPEVQIPLKEIPGGTLMEKLQNSWIALQNQVNCVIADDQDCLSCYKKPIIRRFSYVKKINSCECYENSVSAFKDIKVQDQIQAIECPTKSTSVESRRTSCDTLTFNSSQPGKNYNRWQKSQEESQARLSYATDQRRWVTRTNECHAKVCAKQNDCKPVSAKQNDCKPVCAKQNDCKPVCSTCNLSSTDQKKTTNMPYETHGDSCEVCKKPPNFPRRQSAPADRRTTASLDQPWPVFLCDACKYSITNSKDTPMSMESIKIVPICSMCRRSITELNAVNDATTLATSSSTIKVSEQDDCSCLKTSNESCQNKPVRPSFSDASQKIDGLIQALMRGSNRVSKECQKIDAKCSREIQRISALPVSPTPKPATTATGEEEFQKRTTPTPCPEHMIKIVSNDKEVAENAAKKATEEATKSAQKEEKSKANKSFFRCSHWLKPKPCSESTPQSQTDDCTPPSRKPSQFFRPSKCSDMANYGSGLSSSFHQSHQTESTTSNETSKKSSESCGCGGDDESANVGASSSCKSEKTDDETDVKTCHSSKEACKTNAVSVKSPLDQAYLQQLQNELKAEREKNCRLEEKLKLEKRINAQLNQSIGSIRRSEVSNSSRSVHSAHACRHSHS